METLIGQEAQLPQRNSASAAHVYIGWLLLIVQCKEQNRIGEVVLFFWHSNYITLHYRFFNVA